MPEALSDAHAVDAVHHAITPLTGREREYDELLDLVGDARMVLLGEASHGTHEFYRERALLTRRLIREKGFDAVAVEADWPDAERVNRYVRGRGTDAGPEDALGGFTRFPTWMWRNTVVRDFVAWLRGHNAAIPDPSARVGFYGLDLYSLHTSIAAVLAYLNRVDPVAATRARYCYGCFEHYGEDPHSYGYASSFGLSRNCEDEVVDQLQELMRHAAEYAARDGAAAEDESFYAEQNARLVRNAERYYREMFRGRISSWNLRDRHMAETLVTLERHLGRRGRRPKLVVWEHNSHLGDARATEMHEAGELNVGQLVRERYGREAVLIGFTTFSGTVMAASEWEGPAQRMVVRPALRESYEALFHQVGVPRFLLSFLPGSRGLERDGVMLGVLSEPRLERAIGVIYRPETERLSHYFRATLPEQFDAVVHLDLTRAVDPLDARPVPVFTGEPETYPSGM